MKKQDQLAALAGMRRFEWHTYNSPHTLQLSDCYDNAPKGTGIFPKISCRKKTTSRNPGASQRRSLFPGEISYSSDNLPDNLARGIGAKTVMIGRAINTGTKIASSFIALALSVNLKFMSGSQRYSWGIDTETLCFIPSVLTLNWTHLHFPFFSPLYLCFFNWLREDGQS